MQNLGGKQSVLWAIGKQSIQQVKRGRRNNNFEPMCKQRQQPSIKCSLLHAPNLNNNQFCQIVFAPKKVQACSKIIGKKTGQIQSVKQNVSRNATTVNIMFTFLVYITLKTIESNNLVSNSTFFVHESMCLLSLVRFESKRAYYVPM